MKRYTVPRSRRPRILETAIRMAQAIVAMIALAAFGTANAQPAPAKAGDLVKAMARAAAFVAKAVKEAGASKCSPKVVRQKPFFAALKKTNSCLGEASRALAAKNDKGFLKSLDRTGRSIAGLQRAVRLGEISDARILQGTKSLGVAYATLSKSFSKAGIRRKKGGELSPAEQQQALALAAKYQKSLAQLQTVKGRPGKAPGVVAEVAYLVDGLDRLLAPGRGGKATVEWYTELVSYETEFTGAWYVVASYDSLVDPVTYQSTFAPVNASFADVASYTETVETSFTYESSEFWSSYASASFETTESYDVDISDAEVATYDDYIDHTSVDIEVDEYDVTPGDDDNAFLDHDDDGIIDTVDDDDDGDGIPDDKDLDDDGDGIDDFAEVDSDHDGTPDAIDEDDDNDGIPDADDKDDDGDGIPDDKDNDHDNDNDGIPDDKDDDDDNDGIPDSADDDDDGDGIDDADDTDDDNDGVDDADEGDDAGDHDDSDDAGDDDGPDDDAGDDDGPDDDGGDDAGDDDGPDDEAGDDEV